MKQEQWIDRLRTEWDREQRTRCIDVYPSVGGLFRDAHREWLNLSSNDYLNLARHPDVIAASEAALHAYGAGATASRLVTGTLPPHEQLEHALAEHKGYPTAVLFGSGYMTNAGTIPALVGRGDAVFADRLVHASIIDAVPLSRARLYRFHHNEADHLDTLLKKHNGGGRRLVVTESVFSMDGDLAPLREIAEIAEQRNAMILIDEAHATGVFGPNGKGRIAELGLQEQINISMGTLSKGLAGYGGFAACSDRVRALLINRARTLIFTTALPPAVAGSALGALAVVEKEPGLGETLLRRADHFRNRLREAGLDTMRSESQIIPIRVGDNAAALSLSRRLRAEGILAVPIRPPTVPQGRARLRLSLTLAHTEEDLVRAADAIVTCARKEGRL